MTSVPPTQPPATPETDVRLTEAERDYFRGNLRQNLGYRAWVVEDAMLGHVERIVAERVRVVEGERDAARAERDEMSGWIEEHALVKTLAQIAEWQEATGAELPAMARAAMHAYAARAESAEAAHRALVARLTAQIEAIDKAHGDESLDIESLGLYGVAYRECAADLRALLAGGEER